MLQDLDEILDPRNEKLARTVAFKLEQNISQLPNHKESPIEMYNYLNKAIRYAK